MRLTFVLLLTAPSGHIPSLVGRSDEVIQLTGVVLQYIHSSIYYTRYTNKDHVGTIDMSPTSVNWPLLSCQINESMIDDGSVQCIRDEKN